MLNFTTNDVAWINSSDEEVLQAYNFRARGRLPVVSWCDPGMK